MVDNSVIIAFISIIGGGGLTLAGKALIDHRRRNGNAPAVVPHAKNGFLTLDEIEAKCAREQAKCQKTLTTEIRGGFNLMKSELGARLDSVDKRLDRGDRKFTDLKKTIEGLGQKGV